MHAISGSAVAAVRLVRLWNGADFIWATKLDAVAAWMRERDERDAFGGWNSNGEVQGGSG